MQRDATNCPDPKFQRLGIENLAHAMRNEPSREPHLKSGAGHFPWLEPRQDLVAECLLNILLFYPGHERRALSAQLRDALDHVWPVRALGPPPLPAKACYREPVGASRASYGVWVQAHKAVSLQTHLRPSKRNRRTKWDQTVTQSSVGYGSIHEKALLDPSLSCCFWKAVLSLLRAAETGALQGPSSGSISVCFGGKEAGWQPLERRSGGWRS
ncbi:unnamed protein product [Effrenium voratum]|nr:unnamed protein product [Effrenium voratum]